MAIEYKLSFTASEIDEKLGKIDVLEEEIEKLSGGKADKTGLRLGIHTDGLVYLFVDNTPVGTGINISTDGVSGYVDSNNNIILNNLPNGTYTIKYEMEDGNYIDIGNLELDNNVYYSVTNNLTNCTNSNDAVEVIGGESYSAIISPNSGYEITSMTVTNGGESVAISGDVIDIAEVKGDIVITAVAEKIIVEIVNLIPKSTDASGNLYVGTNGEAGYKTACRIRGTGEEHAYEGYSCTGFIPVTTDEKLYMYGMYADDTSGNSRIALYKTDKTVVRSDIYPTKVGANGDYIDEGNGIYSYTIVDADVAFARISVKKIMDGSEIVTVNQPIV